MEKELSKLLATRTNILKVIEGLSTEQLNKVPEGFNNNIIWNVAHCPVTHQLLTYFMSGNAPLIDQDTIEVYRKGNKPEGDVSSDKIKSIKSLMLSSIEDLKRDLDKLKSSEYKSYMTSYGVELNSLEDAISFLNIHEGVHFGYILALKKAI